MNILNDQSALDQLLSKSIDATVREERTAFDRAAQGAGDRLVLFGAGGMGRRTLQGLRKLGIEPLAFVDSNSFLWHKEVEGITVLPAAEAATRHGSDATFIVTVWGGHSPERMSQRINLLKALGCQRVLSFKLLYCKHPDIFLPHYSFDLPHKVLEHTVEVRRAFDLFAHDDASRAEYISQVRWRIEMDFDALAEPANHETYFPDDLIKIRDDEAYVDGGAYDGDTLAAFLSRQGSKFTSYSAYEPDPANFAKLSLRFNALPIEIRSKVSVRSSALGNRSGTTLCGATGNDASSVGSGTIEVPLVRLDDEVAFKHPSFIKLDIEGSEPEALMGAALIIKNDTPFLALCVYHAQDHLWRIPHQVNSLNQGYRLFLRPHLRETWDLVCYGVPIDRLVR